MARDKIDLNDAVVSPFFVIASLINADLATFDPFGFALGSPLWAVQGATVTPASLIAITAVVAAYVTNKPDLSKVKAVETWVAMATVALVVAVPFVPLLQSVVQSSAIIGLVAVIIQAGGFYTLAYLG